MMQRSGDEWEQSHNALPFARASASVSASSRFRLSASAAIWEAFRSPPASLALKQTAHSADVDGHHRRRHRGDRGRHDHQGSRSNSRTNVFVTRLDCLHHFKNPQIIKSREEFIKFNRAQRRNSRRCGSDRATLYFVLARRHCRKCGRNGQVRRSERLKTFASRCRSDHDV